MEGIIIELLDKYDSSNSIKAVCFAYCDIMTDRGLELISDWEFKQSPMGSDTDCFEYEFLNDYTNDRLIEIQMALYHLYMILTFEE